MKEQVISAKKILILHGPNLNLLGTREPEIYGRVSLDEINRKLSKIAENAGIRLENFQSNAEADLIGRIQQTMSDDTGFIIINPAAFTHTSVALRDALAAVKLPFIEVHLSNIFARETFRRESYFSDLAVGVISGLGSKGYELALEYALTVR
jgi:3-dehydroquinate dehydratase-2